MAFGGRYALPQHYNYRRDFDEPTHVDLCTWSRHGSPYWMQLPIWRRKSLVLRSTTVRSLPSIALTHLFACCSGVDFIDFGATTCQGTLMSLRILLRQPRARRQHLPCSIRLDGKLKDASLEQTRVVTRFITNVDTERSSLIRFAAQRLRRSGYDGRKLKATS